MAGKIRKTAGVLLLIASIIFSQIPSRQASAQDADFRMDGNVLVKYTGNDENISIPDYVKVIGEEAFYDNDFIKSVDISGQVEEIRIHAFYGCDSLTQVSVGDSVKKIGNAAFAECSQLENVSFGEQVKNIGNGVFSECSLLSKIDISEDNDYLQCKSGILTDSDETHLYEMLGGSDVSYYDMPDTIGTISKYAFWGCDQLEYLELSDSMKQIPAYAFSNCRGLKTIIIPYSVTDIGAKAFENCSALQVVEIPETVKNIHTTAFDGCGNLRIKASPASYADTFAREHEVSAISEAEYEEIKASVLEQIEIREEAEEEEETPEETEEDLQEDSEETLQEDPGEDALSEQGRTSDGNTATDEDVMGQTVIVSGQAVVFIDNTTQPVYRGDVDIPLIYQDTAENSAQPFIISDTDADGDLMRGSRIGKGLYIPKYTVAEGTIADQAYYGQTSMSTYEFPEEITQIGDFSFARCGISSIEIPEGITHIGYGAFYHCDHLTQVSIPATVTEINPYAFEKTPWLENWKKSEGTSDFLVVGDGILLAYRGSDSKIEIPDGIKVIAPNCFESHQGIVTVTLSSSVTKIGEEAFKDCSNLATVNGGTGLIEIGDRAFSGCPISTVKINEHVTRIGAKAFDLSATIRRDSFVAVDFKGIELPTVGYDASATKLYHDDYRGLSFEGISAAIVPDKHVTIDGTVLDPYVSGFRGFICTWYEDAPEGEKSLVIMKSTVPVQNTDEIEWPTEITLYGTTYPVAGVLDTAFSYYDDTSWMRNTNSEARVELEVSSSVLTHSEIGSAVLPGNTEHITVTICDDAEAEEAIKTAYGKLYSANDDMVFRGFCVTADTGTGIPLTGFGTNPLQVTIAVPDDMAEDAVYMMCLDRNGQLEAVTTDRMEIDGVDCIRFYANHLSSYALCSIPGMQNSSGTGNLDESPDTGDMSQPRLFLCIGMAAVAMVLILWKDPKKKRVANGTV